MSTTGYASAAEASRQFMPWPAVHYGCRVVELGEDGEDYAVSGHVPERRAKAAVLHLLRTEVGMSYLADRHWFEDIVEGSVDHTWIVPSGNEDEPWEWCDAFREGAEAVTVVSVL